MKRPFLHQLLAMAGLLIFAASFLSAQEPSSSPPPPARSEKAQQKDIVANLNRIPLDNQSITEIAKAGQATGQIAVAAPFVVAVLIVAIAAYAQYRRAQTLHETLRLMVEKGVTIPPELLVPPKQAPNDFRRGVLLIGLGGGLIVALAALAHKGVWSIGLVPLLLGVGYLVVARLGNEAAGWAGSLLARVNDPADAELIARVLLHADDESAYAGLVARHQSFLRHFLRRLTAGDHARADDLAQETFLRAWQKLAAYRGEAPWRTWLCGIAYRLFLAHARRRTPLDEAGELPPGRDEAAPFSPPELTLDLEQAIGRLSAPERAAITLCFQSGCSHEEAAAALDLPLGTLKTHVNRAKEKLRQSLAVWNPR